MRPPERPLAEKGLRANYSHHGELVGWALYLQEDTGSFPQVSYH